LICDIFKHQIENQIIAVVKLTSMSKLYSAFLQELH